MVPRDLRYDNFNIRARRTEPDRHLRRICRLFGMFSAKRLDGWTSLFLVTTVLTSVTGFFFPFHRLLPSHILGILSLIALAIAVYARYSRGLAGGWRRTYAITAAIALYLDVFVLIAQAFQKVPVLKVLAPTQSEPPFLVTQLIVLVIFLGLSVFAQRLPNGFFAARISEQICKARFGSGISAQTFPGGIAWHESRQANPLSPLNSQKRTLCCSSYICYRSPSSLT
jgi:hypothetical protein